MLYCVMRVEQGQRNCILCGKYFGKFSVMVYYVVRFGKGSVILYYVVRFGRGQRNCTLCCEILVRAAYLYIVW
jgi:hypothetical protein